MIGSVTELGTFRRCRWQHRFASFNGRALSRILAPTALSLGSLIHAGHARWEVEPGLSLWTIFMEEAAISEQLTREKWLERTGTNVPDSEMERFFDLVDLGRSMCVNYEEFYGTSLPDGFRVIEPEQTIVVEVPGTQHSKEWIWRAQAWVDCPHSRMVIETTDGEPLEVPECNGYHRLEGTLDSLLADDSDLCWIRERKTYKNRPSIDSLEHNDQFLGYLWLERMVHANSPIQLAGIAYDGMWKRAKPPDRIKDAVTRQYRKGIPDDLFLRKFLSRDELEIDGYHDHLISQLFDIAGRYPHPPEIYPNHRWEGCWDCGFTELCDAKALKEDESGILKFYTIRDKNDRSELYADADEIEIPEGLLR
jgi:hypothetical protein